MKYITEEKAYDIIEHHKYTSDMQIITYYLDKNIFCHLSNNDYSFNTAIESPGGTNSVTRTFALIDAIPLCIDFSNKEIHDKNNFCSVTITLPDVSEYTNKYLYSWESITIITQHLGDRLPLDSLAYIKNKVWNGEWFVYRHHKNELMQTLYHSSNPVDSYKLHKYLNMKCHKKTSIGYSKSGQTWAVKNNDNIYSYYSCGNKYEAISMAQKKIKHERNKNAKIYVECIETGEKIDIQFDGI